MKVFFLSFMISASFAFAGDGEGMEFDTLKTRLKTYEKVRITGADGIGLKITHEGGTARIPYAMLPRELADRFSKNTEAANEQRMKEAAQQDAYHASAGKVSVGEKVPDPASGTPKKSEEELKADAERLAGLQGYVAGLRGQIGEAEKYVQKREARIMGIQGAVERFGRDGYGSDYTWSRGLRKDFNRNLIIRKEKKIKEAEILVKKSEREIIKLEKVK